MAVEGLMANIKRPKHNFTHECLGLGYRVAFCRSSDDPSFSDRSPRCYHCVTVHRIQPMEAHLLVGEK